MSRNPKIIIVVGPTSSGKSDVALRLAQLAQGKQFEKYGIRGAEIISADSRQVYRGMDIGTGKVKRDKLSGFSFQLLERAGQNSKSYKLIANAYYSEGVRHHLLDVADPKRDFSVARFQKLGRKAINDIHKRGRMPIICGGTGLYVDAVAFDVRFSEVKPDKKLRAQFDKLTAEKLFKKLQRIDPARAATIDRHNPRRLIRALEIVMATGRPVPPLPRKPLYDALWIGLALPQAELERRIKKRLDARFKQGMIAEVRRLRKNGLSWKRLESFGLEYRWIAKYLRKKIPLADMKAGLYRDHLRYVKRQMTWFKRNKDIHWLHPSARSGQAKSQALGLARKFLKS